MIPLIKSLNEAVSVPEDVAIRINQEVSDWIHAMQSLTSRIDYDSLIRKGLNQNRFISKFKENIQPIIDDFVESITPSGDIKYKVDFVCTIFNDEQKMEFHGQVKSAWDIKTPTLYTNHLLLSLGIDTHLGIDAVTDKIDNTIYHITNVILHELSHIMQLMRSGKRNHIGTKPFNAKAGGYYTMKHEIEAYAVGTANDLWLQVLKTPNVLDTMNNKIFPILKNGKMRSSIDPMFMRCKDYIHYYNMYHYNMDKYKDDPSIIKVITQTWKRFNKLLYSILIHRVEYYTKIHSEK